MSRLPLVGSLTEPLLAPREPPIDLTRCERCGETYRANGMGHVIHREQCTKNPAASVT